DFSRVKNGTVVSPLWARFAESGAPWFSQQPAGQFKSCGETAVFGVAVAAGTGTGGVQWRKEGGLVGDGASGAGASMAGAGGGGRVGDGVVDHGGGDDEPDDLESERIRRGELRLRGDERVREPGERRGPTERVRDVPAGVLRELRRVEHAAAADGGGLCVLS